MNVPPFNISDVIYRPFVYLRKNFSGKYDLFVAVLTNANYECKDADYQVNGNDVFISLEISSSQGKVADVWYNAYRDIPGAAAIKVQIGQSVYRSSPLLQTVDADENDETYAENIAYNVPYIYLYNFNHLSLNEYKPYCLIPSLDTDVNSGLETQLVTNAPVLMMALADNPSTGGSSGSGLSQHVDNRTIEMIDADTQGRIQWYLVDWLSNYFVLGTLEQEVTNIFEVRLTEKAGLNSNSAAMSFINKGGGRKTKTINKVRAGTIVGLVEEIFRALSRIWSRLFKFK